MIDFIFSRWTFPSLHIWMFVFPSGLIAGSIAGCLTGYLKEKYNLPVGYSRKIFHFIIFTLAGIIGLTGGFEAVQVFGASIGTIVGYAVFVGDRSCLYPAIARPTDAPYERFYIIMPFLMTALGGMLSNILFGEFAIIGYIATGWGDAVGEPVGTRWGRHRYRVPTLTGIKAYRSIEGSIGVFLATFIGCFLFLSTGFDLLFQVVLLTSLTISMATMFVEAITFHSLDNLTIQVTASGLCFYVLKYTGQ